MFIGYARSGHSLVGAILDAHPEIIISHEFNVVDHWDNYKDKTKYRLFYDLHALSQKQAMFRNRAPCLERPGHRYRYHVPGQWRGTYKEQIKVKGI